MTSSSADAISSSRDASVVPFLPRRDGRSARERTSVEAVPAFPGRELIDGGLTERLYAAAARLCSIGIPIVAAVHGPRSVAGWAWQ